MSEIQFAFLIHPRESVQEDMARVFWPLGMVPECLLTWGMKHFPPIVRGEVTLLGSDKIMGWIIVVPLASSQFYSSPRRAQKMVLRAVRRAEDEGAGVVGLGALTSPFTLGGKTLTRDSGRRAIITNGNSLTAAVTALEAGRACQEIKRTTLAEQGVAILGATGSVGTAVSLLLAEQGVPLILLARNEMKLRRLRDRVLSQSPGSKVEATIDLGDLRQAGVVIVVTSGAEQILQPRHLKDGALVYDDTQPRNTSPSLSNNGSGVVVVDGGVIATPRIRYGMDIGLPLGRGYACLVETMLLALEGDPTNHVGAANPDRAKEILELMGKYPDLFSFPPFQSFGVPIGERPTPLGATGILVR